MGHREDLLAGAKRCLYEKGYAHTTARDLVAASGTNLASIGYHFGSKEALLIAALRDALADMGQEFTRISLDRAPTNAEEFAQLWQAAIDRFADYRPLLVAQVEAWAQAERSTQLRDELTALYDRERDQGAAAIRESYAQDEPTARAVSAVAIAIADGISLRWLFDPERAPGGEEIALGLRAFGELLHGAGRAAEAPEAEE